MALILLIEWAEVQIENTLKKLRLHGESTINCLAPTNPRRLAVEENLRQAEAQYLQMQKELDGLKVSPRGHCPVCGEKLKYTSYGQDGYKEECLACGKYVINDEYGCTQIDIGPVTTGYSYTTKNSGQIQDLAYRIGALVREAGL